MFKKNLLGIIIVLLVFAGFYAGYKLGKGGKVPNSGMRPGPGMGQEAVPTSSPSAPATKMALTERAEAVQQNRQVRQERRRQSASDGDLPQGQRTIPVPQRDRAVPQKNMVMKDETVKKTTDTEPNTPLAQTFYGTVVPYAEANVQSRQGGTITLLTGQEGDYVKKSEVLVRFDERDTQLQRQQAIALKNSTLQQVNQAKSNFQTIQSNVNRYRKLFEDGFVSKQQVDELVNQLASANASLHSAQESVTQAEVQVKIIENTLRDFQVKAPIRGLIDEKRYNVGEVYQGGAVIYHLINIDQVYVEVEIPETYLRQIREGIAVSVVFDAIGEQSFPGILETILPSGTADNRSFIAKVFVQNPDHRIKPGMFARIRFDLQ